MDQERTNKEVAEIFTAAGHSVEVINGGQREWETADEWKETVQRNVEHLEIIKEYKKLDEKTSIWTSEDFTAIDKAIVDGKKIYS